MIKRKKGYFFFKKDNLSLFVNKTSAKITPWEGVIFDQDSAGSKRSPEEYLEVMPSAKHRAGAERNPAKCMEQGGYELNCSGYSAGSGRSPEECPETI
jgi:hypothetical protein